MKKLMFLIIFAVCSFTATSYAAVASSVLKPTSDVSKASGKITLEEADNGLKIKATFENVTPGDHAFHIHENGDCSDTGKAAGGHFNPDSHDHGNAIKEGTTNAHAGDLGNVTIDANGSGAIDVVVPGLTLLEGKYSVAGKAFILHEKADDFGQPTGNAGGRIACGVIELTADTSSSIQ